MSVPPSGVSKMKGLNSPWWVWNEWVFPLAVSLKWRIWIPLSGSEMNECSDQSTDSLHTEATASVYMCTRGTLVISIIMSSIYACPFPFGVVSVYHTYFRPPLSMQISIGCMVANPRLLGWIKVLITKYLSTWRTPALPYVLVRRLLGSIYTPTRLN